MKIDIDNKGLKRYLRTLSDIEIVVIFSYISKEFYRRFDDEY